ncbi:hypothetical protein LCGC14_0645210, partial [marine sediment metagenome]
MSTIFGAEYPSSAISLARYAQLINYQDCSFFGVNNPSNNVYACREIWTKDQRDMAALSLAEAQDEIELELEYFVEPKWVTAERHRYTLPLLTAHGSVIAGGIKKTTSLGAAIAVNHAADPAVITIAGLTITSVDCVKIYYPDTDQEIIPSDMTLVAGTLTIEIPRCRLVDYDKLDNPIEGWVYDTISNFQTTVDVKCIENDASTNAVIIWPHGCDGACSATGCSDYRRNGCIYVLDGDIGSVDVLPAAYSAGTWKTSLTGSCCGNPASRVEVNYYSGLQSLPRTVEQT